MRRGRELAFAPHCACAILWYACALLVSAPAVAQVLLERESGSRVEPRAGWAEEPPLWCFTSPPTVSG